MRGAFARKVSARLVHLHSDHIRIARAGLWLMLFTVATRLAGAAKEVAVAWRYGRGPEVDAYNLALTLSTWLPVTLISIMSVVLVPVLVRLRSGDTDDRSRFLHELYGLAMLVGGGTGLLVWVAGPSSLSVFAAHMPVETRTMAMEMLQLFAPLSLVMVFVAVATSRLQAMHDHSYALADALPALTILVLLFAWRIEGTLPLVVGTLGGILLQAWWLERRAHRRDGASFAIALPLRSAHWVVVSRSFLVMGTGQLLVSFVSPVDQWVAASLGAGENATLGYANRILAMVMTVGAAAISRSTLPVFSEGIAGGKAIRVHRHALHWSLLMLGVGLVAALSLVVGAPWLVALLFERGAFGPEDTQMVAVALQGGALQLPPYFAALVLVSLLASQGRYGLLTLAAALSLAGKLAANYALAPAFGVPGLLLATAAMYALSAMVCVAAVMRKNRAS